MSRDEQQVPLSWCFDEVALFWRGNVAPGSKGRQMGLRCHLVTDISLHCCQVHSSKWQSAATLGPFSIFPPLPSGGGGGPQILPSQCLGSAYGCPTPKTVHSEKAAWRPQQSSLHCKACQSISLGMLQVVASLVILSTQHSTLESLAGLSALLRICCILICFC